jgi:DNA replication protein DnaC
MTNTPNSTNDDNYYNDFKAVDKSREPEPCKYCGRLLRYIGIEFSGKILFSHLEHCNCKEYKKEQEQIKKQEEEEEKQKALREQIKRIEEMFSRSKLGQRFRSRTFKNFQVTGKNIKAFQIAQDYAKNFEKHKEKGEGLIFLSKQYGTGKTHLAASIANHLILKEYIPVIFGTLGTLLDEIRKSYDDDSKYRTAQIEYQLKNIPLLIVDDLGKERVNEWYLEKLYSIINFRYENMKPVIITTNLTLDEMEETFNKKNMDVGGAIVSRLIETCRIINLEGEDYRKKTRRGERT